MSGWNFSNQILDGAGGVMTLGDGVTPQDLGGFGATFQVFDWLGVDRVGEFDQIVLSGNYGGYSWDASNLYVDGRIVLVPEPSVVALLILGGVAVLGGAVRRRPPTKRTALLAPRFRG